MDPDSLAPPYPLSEFLPVEMVDKILLYLPQRDLLAASSTCTAWRQSMADNAALWKNCMAPISAHQRYIWANPFHWQHIHALMSTATPLSHSLYQFVHQLSLTDQFMRLTLVQCLIFYGTIIFSNFNLFLQNDNHWLWYWIVVAGACSVTYDLQVHFLYIGSPNRIYAYLFAYRGNQLTDSVLSLSVFFTLFLKVHVIECVLFLAWAYTHFARIRNTKFRGATSFSLSCAHDFHITYDFPAIMCVCFGVLEFPFYFLAIASIWLLIATRFSREFEKTQTSTDSNGGGRKFREIREIRETRETREFKEYFIKSREILREVREIREIREWQEEEGNEGENERPNNIGENNRRENQGEYNANNNYESQLNYNLVGETLLSPRKQRKIKPALDFNSVVSWGVVVFSLLMLDCLRTDGFQNFISNLLVSLARTPVVQIAAWTLFEVWNEHSQPDLLSTVITNRWWNTLASVLCAMQLSRFVYLFCSIFSILVNKNVS